MKLLVIAFSFAATLVFASAAEACVKCISVTQCVSGGNKLECEIIEGGCFAFGQCTGALAFSKCRGGWAIVKAEVTLSPRDTRLLAQYQMITPAQWINAARFVDVVARLPRRDETSVYH